MAKRYVDGTRWYSLYHDDDGFYSIELEPDAPVTAPMADTEGADVTSVTFGVQYFDTWEDLGAFADDVREAASQLSLLEDSMRADAGVDWD